MMMDVRQGAVAPLWGSAASFSKANAGCSKPLARLEGLQDPALIPPVLCCPQHLHPAKTDFRICKLEYLLKSILSANHLTNFEME